MAGWKNRGTNKSNWDDGDLDTESAEPMRAKPSKKNSATGASLDKGNSKQGWFNATIAKIPSHHRNKNKKSPVGSTSPSPTSMRTPPRMAGASTSPGPSRRGSEAFNVLDSAAFTSYGTSDHVRKSCVMDRYASASTPGGSTPSDMSAALEELKRDVKGLHEAFNSLHKEHTELRGELRMRGGVFSGGLPVESISGGKGLDYRASGRPTAGRSPFGSEHDAAVPEAAAPLPGEGTSFFGGLLKTCGLEDLAGASNMLKDAAAPTDETPAKSTPLRSSRGMPKPSFNRSGTNGLNRSGTTDLSDLSTPAPAEGGGSARGVSPHDREPPMSIRSNLRRPPGVSPSGGGELIAPPAFGRTGTSSLGDSPRPHGGMTSSQSEAPRAAAKVPHFGTEAPGHSGRVKVSYMEPDGQRPDSPGRQTIGMSATSETHSDAGSTAGSTASKATWRSPQAGEPLVLPFPDAGGSDSEDDTIGKPPMPPPAGSIGMTGSQTSRF